MPEGKRKPPAGEGFSGEPHESGKSPKFSYQQIHAKKHYFVKKRQFFKHFGVLMTKKRLFSQLLNKAISMALWTKAITCDKAGFKSRFCQEHQAGKNIISVNPVILPALEFRRRGSNSSLCLCAFLWLKNPFNQRNPWLINDLRLCKVLYNCRETFTDVMSPLQIRLFMQNKAKFRKSQMSVTNLLTRDYDKMDTWSIRKKQSQTNPNKAKFKKDKMNVTSILTVGYENKPPIWAQKKQSQTSKRQKPMQTSLSKRIMKETRFWVGKNKPKTNPTCRGVASGEDGTNPISKQLQSPICLGNLLINPMFQIYCVCSFSVSFDSAKMALYTGNRNLDKDGRKKLNLLKYKRLNGPGRMRPLTGTPFAHSYLGKIVLTN